MNSQTLTSKIVECAALYRSKAVGRDYRFVYADETDIYRYINVSFKDSNFGHLVGIKQQPGRYSMREIFNRATHHKLSPNDYTVLKPGLCELKLQAFPSLMDFEHQVKYIGFYNGVKFMLDTELITGNTAASMGFIREDNGVYYPNTVLMQDCRSLLRDRYRILAIYRKPTRDIDFAERVMQDKRFDEDRYIASLK